MKKTVAILLLFFCTFSLLGNENDSLYTLLKIELAKKDYYANKKEERIKQIKRSLLPKDISIEDRYNTNYLLYTEYEKYQIDSAIVYLKKNIEIAETEKNKDWLIESQLLLSPLYSTKGLYIDALKILDNLSKQNLTNKQKTFLYKGYSLLYRHYAQSSGVSSIYIKSDLYKDSLIMTLDTNSLEYKIEHIQLDLNEIKNIEKNRTALFELLPKLDPNTKEYPLVAYLIGYSYEIEDQRELEIKYYILAAIADIRNAIKDNASFQALALVFYEEGKGDIDLAYACNKSSMEDAIFANVRYRAIDSSNTYPIITSSYQQKENEQKKTLIFFLTLSIVLSLGLIIAIIHIYRQMKRVAKIRKELYVVNKNLSNLNEDLHSVNLNLEEANHVKEQYITYSFDLCSNYIDKIEKFKNSLNKRFQTKKIDDMAKILASDELISSELKEFYNNFDKMFLGIYPTFVEDFNQLLIPDKSIKVKEGELLSPELRIFALIRLGIKDSSRIANYLHYSMSTIYNYRTKIKGRSDIPREQFEDYVMKIGSISLDINKKN